MLKRTFFLTIIATVAFSFYGCSSQNNNQPPNIIFIMADDHSVGATSVYGNALRETPNIDRLAAEGMRFNNCFNVVSLCGPSRATILSGRYSVHNGYMRNRDKFDRNQVTFPKLLQTAGYETAVIGKWHLVTEPSGFDYYNVIPFQGQYFDCPMKEIGQPWEDGNKGGIVQTGYLTDVITDKAIGWLKSRNSDKPFCLLVHHKAPHGNYHYPDKYKEIFADTTLPEPDNFYDSFEGKNPALINNYAGFSKLENTHPNHFNEKVPDTLLAGTVGYKKWAYQNIYKGYYRLVASLDENIGRLIDFIDETGLKDKTLIVYTSDNGWFMGDHGLFNKMWMYEESLHVPLIIRYPEEVRPSTVTDNIVSVLDFGPTFLDYAGLENHALFQGKSIRPLLNGKKPEDSNAAHFYHYFGQFEVPSHYGIRTEEYKLIYFYELEEEPKWELYDLKNDPDEMVNLAFNNDYKKVFEEMKIRLEEKQKECEEQLP